MLWREITLFGQIKDLLTLEQLAVLGTYVHAVTTGP